MRIDEKTGETLLTAAEHRDLVLKRYLQKEKDRIIRFASYMEWNWADPDYIIDIIVERVAVRKKYIEFCKGSWQCLQNC